MIVKIALAVLAAFAPWILMSAPASAQDVPGIEICTVEKTMERRTSCLQSKVDFLMKTTARLGGDPQQKTVDDLKKASEDQKKKTDAAAAKDAPAAKDGAK